ncbi:MAG: ribonuclease HI [Myxococcales bacterium]|nr:ribonuclease HI [Myxococcales bacterium]
MPWISRLLRGERVWVRATPEGKLAAATDGRVEVLYKKGGKVYRAAVRNLSPDPQPETLADGEAAPGATLRPKEPTAARAPTATASDGNTFIIYVDGACTGNPGPCGIGVVLLDGAERRELSEYLGHGTNNVAELTAIIRGLEHAPKDRRVLLHSDSAYALGLLGKSWKAKANRELVERMREVAKGFLDLQLVKVPGHAGIPENERADELARDAVVRRR